MNKVKYFLSGVMAAGWFCLAIAVFVQSISTTSVPVVSTGVLARAGGRQGECLTAVEGKAGHDWLDQMQLCMTQAASRLLETGNRSEDHGTAARGLRQYLHEGRLTRRDIRIGSATPAPRLGRFEATLCSTRST